MPVRPLSQIRELAQAVATAFALAELEPEEWAPRQIAHTDLPWAVPPLILRETLGKLPLQGVFDHPMNITPAALMQFWRTVLHDLWHTPGLAVKKGVYAASGRLDKLSRTGTRAFRFALPPGYGEGLPEETAGLQLSLEVAHAAYISLPVRRRVLDESNYYVELADGTIFGVKDGRPAIESPWVLSGEHRILDMVEMSRGPTTFTCMYDQIASLRSILHTHPRKFRKDFAGLDVALQGLRFLTWNTTCPDLISAMHLAPSHTGPERMKEQVLWDAMDVAGTDRMSDRQRLLTLESLLVPAVIPLTRFRRLIFSSSAYPFTMTRDKALQVEDAVRTLYETEVPCKLKRNR